MAPQLGANRRPALGSTRGGTRDNLDENGAIISQHLRT